MSRSGKKLSIVVIIVFLLAISGLFMPKHILRYFYWNFADIHDHEKFPRLAVGNNPEQISRLMFASEAFQFELPGAYQNQEADNFEEFLENHESVAFIVIHDDSIIYENYFDGFNDNSIIPSFSVSKSFVSALTGIAIDEGYIYSTQQPITFFLKELGADFDAITIEHLLNMQSGIKFNEGYSNPMADMAKYYYGTDLKSYIKDLSIEEAPGVHYNYKSINTLLLGLIVERATNTKLSTYLERKIWKPAGMESKASWSIDSEVNQTIKSFCCINAVARDYARFGLIYLHGGYWNNQQIVPGAWVDSSTQIINDSRDSQNYPYTYQWRVLENGAFFAKGILGQYIFVFPEKNLVFVRLGKAYAGVDWAGFCNELSNQVP